MPQRRSRGAEPEKASESEDPINRNGKRRKARCAEDVRREWVEDADGCRSLVVGDGPSSSYLIFDTDGKFKAAIIAKKYLQQRLGKLTRAKRGEDRFEHEFLVGQLGALGRPGSIRKRYQPLRAGLGKIYAASPPIAEPKNWLEAMTYRDEDFSRYCMFVPILESIRQILIQTDDSKAKDLLSRFATRVQAARKLLTTEVDFEAHEGFIKAIKKFASKNDREPTMVEIGKLLFPYRARAGDTRKRADSRRAVRINQLANETGFWWLPEGKHGPQNSLKR
jgi:hypothetical protein